MTPSSAGYRVKRRQHRDESAARYARFLVGRSRFTELRKAHREMLIAEQGAVFVSAVTGWEISAKVRLGKWREAAPLLPGLDKVVEQAGMQALPLTMPQAERAGSFAVEHRDPFDRLLAAQALDQGLTLLTVDPAFEQFGCRVF